MRSNRERMIDIQEAISNIEKYSNLGKEKFFEDELIQIWVIHHLQIIGEAVKATSAEFKEKYPQIPWQDIADFRNIIIHEYFRLNLKIVWLIIENELLKLKQEINQIIEHD